MSLKPPPNLRQTPFVMKPVDLYVRCDLENEEKQKVSPRTFFGVDFRKHMEHTDDPGSKDHQELDLGR